MSKQDDLVKKSTKGEHGEEIDNESLQQRSTSSSKKAVQTHRTDSSSERAKKKAKRQRHSRSKDYDSSDSERKRKTHRKRKDKKDDRKKRKKKRNRQESLSSSSDEGDYGRSVITGKKIKMKIVKTDEDVAQEAARKQLLDFMNSSYK